MIFHNRKKNLSIGLGVVCALGLLAAAPHSAVASDAGGSTGTGTATVLIEEPIAIEANSMVLSFGTIIPHGTGTGFVTVEPGMIGPRTGDQHVTLVNDGTRTGAGKFHISGVPGRQFFIDLPDSATINSGEDESMNVDMFVSSPPEDLVIPMDGSGYTLWVGGRLEVAPNQASGSYSGTYTVTVRYP
ncbi:DUF4402 domain-containing protein [Roseospirillum parvum]|uniref:DUF4402 domain-containing protein n=1 Tax=Roseospirillum parvum TaxID=83401 RepID=A0A1G8FB96_9PROT|nr:DUF4402 domain-containing protein [Roseospirillum parvum]SDH79352.1 protein of unknown function [Roseospirillum parvum]